MEPGIDFSFSSKIFILSANLLFSLYKFPIIRCKNESPLVTPTRVEGSLSLLGTPTREKGSLSLPGTPTREEGALSPPECSSKGEDALSLPGSGSLHCNAGKSPNIQTLKNVKVVILIQVCKTMVETDLRADL